MKYIVIGKQGAGKSTFGGHLAEELKTKATDTSAWLVEVETARQKALKERYQIDGTLMTNARPLGQVQSWDEARNRPCRELLVALGDAVNSVGNTFLVDRCFEKGDIAIGVRRKNELAEIKARYPDVVVILVDRNAGGEQAKDNFELGIADTEHLVVRAKTLDGAKKIAETFAKIVQERLEVNHLVLLEEPDGSIKMSTF